MDCMVKIDYAKLVDHSARKCWTIAQLGEAAGMPAASIYNIRQKTRGVRSVTAHRLARALGVSVSQISDRARSASKAAAK